MAILPMKQVTIIGMKSSQKEILEALQRLGVVEIQPFEEDGFQRPDIGASQSVFAQNARIAENALKILNSVSPEKTSLFASLEGRKTITQSEYYKFADEENEIMRIAEECEQLNRDNIELSSEIIKINTQLESLSPWLALDVPLDFSGTGKTSSFIGYFPEELSADDVISTLSIDENPPPVHIEIISQTKMQTCVFIICYSKNTDFVEEKLRAMGFARPASSTSGNPADKVHQLKSSALKLQKQIDENNKKISSFSGMRSSWRFMCDYYAMRSDRHRIMESLGEKNLSFVTKGFVPERDCTKVVNLLEGKYNSAVIISDIPSDEDFPILLHNNSFAGAVEPVVESYGIPSRGEIDPSGITAIFYYILFGMMLSDAAYGIIMTISCAVCLKKFKNMEEGMKKALTMFMYCGISTIFWGVMFGGFFGDAIGVIASTFFNSDIAFNPIWFSPLDDPMKMLFFSFAIGVVHVFVGLGIAMYQKLKSGQISDAVCSVLFWYLIVGGLIVTLCAQPMFTDMSGIDFNLPPSASTISLAIAGVGTLGIIITGGRPTKNPLKRVLIGFYELYNITGYLSDVLSYSRLLALGLATGVISSVFNQMGSMAGNGPLGITIFIFSFTIGHTLNILINLLGSYVHTNRLQYVEFFGKFYEGGGRKFNPFAVNTKHFKIKEDLNNVS